MPLSFVPPTHECRRQYHVFDDVTARIDDVTVARTGAAAVAADDVMTMGTVWNGRVVTDEQKRLQMLMLLIDRSISHRTALASHHKMFITCTASYFFFWKI